MLKIFVRFENANYIHRRFESIHSLTKPQTASLLLTFLKEYFIIQQ